MNLYYERLIYQKRSHFRKAKTLPGHAIHNGMDSLRDMVIVTPAQNNRTIHASHCETKDLVTVYLWISGQYIRHQSFDVHCCLQVCLNLIGIIIIIINHNV